MTFNLPEQMIQMELLLFKELMLCCQLQRSYIQACGLYPQSEQLKFTTYCQNTNKQDEITVNYPFGVIKLNLVFAPDNNPIRSLENSNFQ